MAVTSSIKLTQGSHTDLPGRAVFGTLTDGSVAFQNADNTGVGCWLWTMIDVPPGSAIPVGFVAATATGTFPQPDVRGGYLLELTVGDGATIGGSTVTATSQITLQVVELSGRYIPPFKGTDASMAFGGQTRGWAPAMEAWLHFLDGLVTGVRSVHGRVGTVVAVAGDYTSTQINNASTVAGSTVTDALNTLKTGLTTAGPIVSVFGRVGVIAAALNDYTSSLVQNLSSVAGGGTTVTTALNSLQTQITASVSGVSSVFGRSGAVVAALNDYTSSLIQNTSTVAGSTVTAALDTLKAALPTAGAVSSVFGRAGAVVAVLNDYTSSLVQNLSSVTSGGSTVTTALNALQTQITASVSGVSSVFGRAGAVVAVLNDYTSSLIQNLSSVVGGGTTVTTALNALQTQVTTGSARFGATFYVDPSFAGTSSGTQSNPYTSITAAIGAAPGTGALIIMAPYSVSTENVTFPTTGNWEVQASEWSDHFPQINGNVVCSGAGGNVGLANIEVTGTVTGVSTGTRSLLLYGFAVGGAVNLSVTGAGTWLVLASGIGGVALAGGFSIGRFTSAVSIAGFIQASQCNFLSAFSTTVASQLFGCRMASGSIGVGGSLLVEDTTFSVAPTFSGSAVVTMDGYSHASALAAGGITLAGGATLVLLNSVNPSGIQRAAATSDQTLVWNGTAWVPTTMTSTMVTNLSSVAGAKVTDALNALQTQIAATGSARFGATFYVDPSFAGTSSGTQSNPYTSITAAIAAAPSTGAVIVLAPYVVTTENVTFPTTGFWEVIALEQDREAAINGNVVCSGAGGIVSLSNIGVLGTITGVSTGDRFLILTNFGVGGAVNLTTSGAGTWKLFSAGLGTVTLSAGPGTRFNSSVSVVGAIHASFTYFTGTVASTAASVLLGCRMVSGGFSVGVSLLVEDTTFSAAPTFAGSAVVSMDGYSHASALAAGGISLTGGATLALLNSVNPSGIQQGGATSDQTLVWNGTAWLPTTMTSTKVTNLSTVTGSTVTAALDALKASVTSLVTGVSSVFGRAGAVVAVLNDYTSSLVQNLSSVTSGGTTVTTALNSLQSQITASVSGVSSVFGRSGAVVAVLNDYSSSLVQNLSTVTGSTVTAALDALKAALPTAGPIISVFGRTGTVVAVLNDYTSSLVQNLSSVTSGGSTVTTALNALQTQVTSVVNTVASLVTGVSSVFGRTGAVAAASGDYNTTQISNASSVTGSTGTAALNNLLREYQFVIGLFGNLTINSNVYVAALFTAANSTPAVVTIPLETSHGFPVGSRFSFVSLSPATATVSFAASAGVTIRGLGGLPTVIPLGAVVSFDYAGSDVWMATIVTANPNGGYVWLPLVPIEKAPAGSVGNWSFDSTIGWTGGSYSGVFTDPISFPIGPISADARFVELRVLIAPNNAHSNVPAVPTKVFICKRTTATASSAIIASFTDPTTPVGAYNTPHEIVCSGWTAAEATPDNSSYWFVIVQENGANALVGTRLISARMLLQ